MKRTSPRGTAKHPAKRHGEAGAGAARKAAPATQPKRRQRKTDWIDTLDAAHECCATIEMVAGLLEACDDWINPQLVRNAGGQLNQQVITIRELLEDWHKKGVRK